MVKVELATGDMPAILVQVKRLVARFWLYQHGGIYWLVFIDAIRVGNSIADIDFAEKHATGTLFEHAKGATGDAEMCIVLAVQEALWHIATVIHVTTFIIAIEERETAVAKRLDDGAQNAFERTAWNDVLAAFILHELRWLFGISRDVTRIGNEDGRFGEHVNIYMAGIQLPRLLSDQLIMPDRFAALWRSIPIDTREIIRVHLLYSAGLRPENRNNLTWPVLLSAYSFTASCTRCAFCELLGLRSG